MNNPSTRSITCSVILRSLRNKSRRFLNVRKSVSWVALNLLQTRTISSDENFLLEVVSCEVGRSVVKEIRSRPSASRCGKLVSDNQNRLAVLRFVDALCYSLQLQIQMSSYSIPALKVTAPIVSSGKGRPYKLGFSPMLDQNRRFSEHRLLGWTAVRKDTKSDGWAVGIQAQRHDQSTAEKSKVKECLQCGRLYRDDENAPSACKYHGHMTGRCNLFVILFFQWACSRTFLCFPSVSSPPSSVEAGSCWALNTLLEGSLGTWDCIDPRQNGTPWCRLTRTNLHNLLRLLPYKYLQFYFNSNQLLVG